MAAAKKSLITKGLSLQYRPVMGSLDSRVQFSCVVGCLEDDQSTFNGFVSLGVNQPSVFMHALCTDIVLFFLASLGLLRKVDTTFLVDHTMTI